MHNMLQNRFLLQVRRLTFKSEIILYDFSNDSNQHCIFSSENPAYPAEEIDEEHHIINIFRIQTVSIIEQSVHLEAIGKVNMNEP